MALHSLLLVLGAYGRFTGNLPATSPYAHLHALAGEPSDLPSGPAEVAMRDAEIAVVQHCATAEQQARVRAMSAAPTRDARRRIWMESDGTAAPVRL